MKTQNVKKNHTRILLNQLTFIKDEETACGVSEVTQQGLRLVKPQLTLGTWQILNTSADHSAILLSNRNASSGIFPDEGASLAVHRGQDQHKYHLMMRRRSSTQPGLKCLCGPQHPLTYLKFCSPSTNTIVLCISLKSENGTQLLESRLTHR